ncbi:MAG: SDR family oxidoreductase [Anaerolineae bacterium]|nr:SDR family oxidoreductase [Anaerolineae bacterium]MCB0224006.1 SDR family oxidoreductase [Anaerolineae bacterium]MCB9105222.1 SDR family oxidoreductase [Anaerolineales bacterium]
MMTRIALVTGANRGIGFEVCRQLAQQGLQVILTSRDVAKGQAAADVLRGEGLDISAHQLDVTDVDSVMALQAEIEAIFGRLDVLVNNAGVYLDEGVSIFDVSLEAWELTQAVNFYGPLYLCRAFIPMMHLKGYGRIVNVSSGYGSMAEMGGYTAAYRISKLALNALTRIVAAEITGHNIKINSMCPGWVNTTMGGPAAPKSPVAGADTITWLATLPDDGPTGGFFRDRQPIPW